MDQFSDCIEREAQKRDWDQSNSAVNEQPESETKRQCTEQAWTMPGLSLSDSYPFTSSLTPMSQFGDSEVYLQQDDIWAGFQDEQPISNIESMDIFNLAREQSQIEFSLDLVEQPSDSFLQAPETPGVGRFFPTPDSGCNDPDVQAETISTLGAHPEKNLTSQSFHTKPYDVCFGMVIVSASCHSLPKETEDLISLNVQVLGDVLKFYRGKSNNNVGILSLPALGKLAREFNVTFSAKCEMPKEDKDKRHSLGHKDTLVQIVIYGLCKDIDAVESILSESNLFLQHPTQRDTSVPYENPQFLIAPGTEMPQIEDLTSESISTLTTLEQCLDKKWANEVFQTFDAVDGPATFACVEPSPRLQTELQEHQIKALAMMTEKERGILEGADFPCLWEILRDFDGNVRYRHTVTGITKYTRPQPFAGGILADEMGLGKTLSVLALIAWYLDSLTLEKIGSSSTLIITTLSTIPGWQEQISRHFWPGKIRAVVFHGQNRHNLSKELLNNDIVITTYDTLRSEWSSGSANSVLFSNSEGWARVVLDEAHHIRSRSSQIFQAACAVRARYRWCLTGTPIQNSLDDYAALIFFVGVPPFTGPFGRTSFAEWVSTPIHSSARHTLGIQRLRKLVAATCLRRTKNHIQDQLKLPPRVEKIEFVELDPEERSLYDFFKTRASSLVVGKFTQRSEMDKARWGTMLSLIGFLRLICNHGEQLLPAAAIELWNNQNVSPVDFHCDETDFDLERFEVSPIDDNPNLPLASILPNEVMEADYRPSSKVNALLRNLQNEQRGNQSLSEAPVKSVIFSFWTKMLDLLEVALQANNFVFQRIDGKTPLDKRSMALKRFNEDSSCTVMLASIGSVAEGVDLTAASCVHLVEPQWNPMVEAQAVDRVHRIGQIRDVTITRYIVAESIEKYVQQIQQAKQKLVQQSFGDEIPDQSALSETRFQKLLELLA